MGPLKGTTVIELAGLGPAPMGGMILADMGATVIRVERPGAIDPRVAEPTSGRGKKSIVLNLKAEEGRAALMTLVRSADVLIDPFRPGVCEKLGFSPEQCLSENSALVFARMTGWGQTGPLANAAGHDINYIALTGALHSIGRRDDKPIVPLNLIGDMGGGGMLLVNGILAALLETRSSGQGQVIDVAMVDGTAQLMWMMQGFSQQGVWDGSKRESNLLDGGAHFYNTYTCADGRYICIGSIEPQFYALLQQLAELPDEFQDQMNPEKWPELTEKLAAIFLTRTRDQWCQLMEGTDICFSPVLTLEEAPDHPANRARDTYIDVGGKTQHAPAPRFSRTPSEVAHPTRAAGADTKEILEVAGLSAQAIEDLLHSGAAVNADSN